MRRSTTLGGKDAARRGDLQAFVRAESQSLPTVDVYAQAPTTAQAIALANGAVTGFATFVNQLNAKQRLRWASASRSVLWARRLEASSIRVRARRSRSSLLRGIRSLVLVVLFVSRLRANLRAAKRSGVDDLFRVPEDD